MTGYKAFELAFSRVFKHEAGYQCDPVDRGNWTSGKVGEGELKGTKYGISAMSYPKLDIANLTYEAAKNIYWSDWWNKFDFKSYGAAVGYQLFDAAINHGMSSAIKMLQRAVGVEDDGHIGPITRQAVWQVEESDIVNLFLAERLVFMTYCTGWDRYGKGWSRRIAQNMVIAADDID